MWNITIIFLSDVQRYKHWRNDLPSQHCSPSILSSKLRPSQSSHSSGWYLKIFHILSTCSVGICTYLNNVTFPLKRIAGANSRGKNSSWIEYDREDRSRMSFSRRESAVIPEPSSKSSGRKRRDSIGSITSVGSKYHGDGGGRSGQTANDVTKIVATDDYFSDINVKSSRRLMNVVYVMSRLMKAFQIDFNWSNLATWVNLTEQWPYRW